MKIIIAIVIFSAIVLIHESGHFLLAKWSGITVNEFSLGMGPRIWSTEKNGTRYSLKALPFGGSCAMAGEDMDDDAPGTFNSAPVGKRIAVVAAGPVFNFILAMILAVIIVGFRGYSPAEITSVKSGSTAEEAGLQTGDVITRFNGYHIDMSDDLYLYTYLREIKANETIELEVIRDGEKINISYQPGIISRYLLGFNQDPENEMRVASLIPGLPLEQAGLEVGDVITSINGVDVTKAGSYSEYISEHPLGNEEVTITFVRDGLEYEKKIVPAEYQTPDAGFSYNLALQRVSGLDVVKYGAVEVKFLIRSTIFSLKELVSGHLDVKELSGPVGVVDAIGDTYEQSKSEGLLTVIVNMLYMATLLTANLGVMNLLPLPALDGGRLVFLILEAIRRKPVNRNVEGGIHFAGFVLLMVMMVFVMYNDVLKLF
ncbi:MAG: RIP metalloprotease RseP [Eubacteriales bacterium]|nr:RIP metalloprotease RseP [Eubacteriales bacterium]